MMILVLLRKSPTYGYNLIRRLEREFSTWKPKTGTIYPALESLDKKEFVRYKLIEREGPDIKKYELTLKGENKIKEAFREMEEEFRFMDQYFSFLEKNILEEEKKVFKELLEVLR